MKVKEFQLVSRKTERGLEVTIARSKPAPEPGTSLHLNEKDRQRLIEAVSKSQVMRAEIILRHKSPGFVKDDEGIPLIVKASCRGDLEMVNLLIEKNAGFSSDEIDSLILEITRKAPSRQIQKD